PFAQEKCNGKDDNCLNGVDEEGASDCTVYYYDGDNDGYGVTGNSKCLCSTSGNFDATLSGDCNDNDKNINPAEQEKCNNKDDNCNNNTDEGTAVQLCGSVANGSPKCDNGTCKISSCSTGWEDIDGQFTSGCECEWDSDDKSGYGNSCPGTVIDLGTLTDNSAKIVTKSSKINPNSDVDWYKFTATDSADSGSPSSLGSDKFHVRARFLSPVSNNPFAFDIFKGGCASILCDGAKDFNWFTNGRCGSGAAAKGEAPCLTKSTCDNNNVCPDGTAANYCADESSVYYIKVYRLSGAASDCSGTEYSIEVSNGAYSAPPCPW
ncbi:MAG: hypothetical protein FJ088_06480, partial [Deltaproteobacteria bacterium]|nr:hypothetical protein [Deltaproteobacteria bacterium]